MSFKFPGSGPRLTFDKQWVKPTDQRDLTTGELNRAGPFVSDIVNYIGETVGYRRWWFGIRPRMPIGGVAKRILVGIQLRRADGASSSPHAPLSTKGDTVANETRGEGAPFIPALPRIAMRKVRGIRLNVRF
jgi:hypothetical protein